MTDDTTPTPAVPPSIQAERARIEPSPPPKKLDALPVLYLVGFVILAASLIYLWKHPGLPRGAALEVARIDEVRGQINTIQGRVDQLEAKPAAVAPLEARLAELERRAAASPAVNLPALEGRLAAVESRPIAQPPPDLRLIEERVAALDSRPAPPDLKPIEARIAALETKPPVDLRPLEAQVAAVASKPPIDLKPLDSRIAALEAKPLVDLHPLEAQVAAVAAKPPVDLRPLDTRIVALEAKPPVDLGPLQQRIDAAGQKQTQDDAALAARLGALEAAAKQSDAKLAAVAARAQMAGKLQGVSASLAAGQQLGEIPGAPPALAKFAHAAPPTEAGLRLSFDAAAADAHRVSQPSATGDEPLLNRMWSRAQQSVTVRRGDQVLVGDPMEGVVARARQSLDAGDLAGAVKALDGLAGPAKQAMSGWVAQAQALLDARAAIGELAAQG